MTKRKQWLFNDVSFWTVAEEYLPPFMIAELNKYGAHHDKRFSDKCTVSSDKVMFELYGRVRSHLQGYHRIEIFNRDKHICQNSKCNETRFLELAHVSSIHRFDIALGISSKDRGDNILSWRALFDSYRDDNLVCLCQMCHGSYHKKGSYSRDRYNKVRSLFRAIKTDRGWYTPDVLYREAYDGERVL